MSGYPPPTTRSKRRLLADAAFNPSSADPLTILSLSLETLDDGTVSPPMMLECHGPLALETEHLVSGDEITFEYSTHWPHKVYDREREVGVYIEKWVCRGIIAMSRARSGPLRTPPAREGFWGEYEKMAYAEFARQVHRR
jgi:hypothetical protein